MARTLTSAPEGAVLPAALSAFLKRRAAEIVGLALGIVAIMVFVALLSYSPTDPSLNNATDQTVTNLLGHFGAIAADISLQSAGVCAILPAIVLLAWGWQLMRKRPIENLAVRVIMLIIAVMLASISVAALSVPGNWPLVTGLGGFTGEALFAQLTPFAAMAHPVYGPVLLAALAGGISVALIIYVLGWSRRDWLALVQVFRATGSGIYRGLQLGGRAADRIHALREQYLSGGGHEPDEYPEDGDEKPKTKQRVRKTTDVTDPLVEARKKRLKTSRKADKERQKTMDFGDANVYTHPPLELLEEGATAKVQTRIDKDLLEQNAAFLSTVLEDFGIRGEIVKVRPGPVVTLYELEPAPGTKTSRVIGLSDDIARSMSAISVRVAVVPGRSVIGIELPNSRREMVGLRELLASEAFEKTGGNLPLALAVTAGIAFNTDMPAIVDRGAGDADNIQLMAQVVANTQVLDGRLGLGLVPSYVHNSAIFAVDRQHTITLGTYAHFELNPMWGLFVEYAPTLEGYQGILLPGESGRSHDSLSLGATLSTGGHDFYLFATNNTRLNAAQYLVGAPTDAAPDNWHLAFGITRHL